MLEKLAELDAEHAKAVAGGGEKYVERHHERGKLLVRERIELLLDPGSPFLELSPLAAWGSDYTVGASVVTGIGVVNGVECMINGSDPTVRGGASNPYTLKKVLRANEIALENRLPVIGLVESGGADLPTQKEIFIPGGQIFRDLTRLSAAGIPTHRAGVRQLDRRRRVHPRHERLRRHGQGAGEGVPGRAAAGEDGDRRGVRRRVARRRRDARAARPAWPTTSPSTSTTRSGIGREIVGRLNWRKHGPAPKPDPDAAAATTPRTCSASCRPTSRCRSTRAR